MTSERVTPTYYIPTRYERERADDDYADGYHAGGCTCAPCVERVNIQVQGIPVEEHDPWCRCSVHVGRSTDVWEDDRDHIGEGDFEAHFFGIERIERIEPRAS